MTRTLFACVAVAFGASAVLAASPEVDKAIKTIQSVSADPAKMKLFCALDDATAEDDEDAAGENAAAAKKEKAAASEKEDAAADAEDAAVDKEIDGLLGKLGADFTAAWNAGADLDENSADAKEYAAAVDALTAKCK